MSTQKGKPKKRVPKKVRPANTEDIQTALANLLKSHTAAEMKADFDAAHKAGMDALHRRDYDALGDAIAREREVIDTVTRSIKPTKGRK